MTPSKADLVALDLFAGTGWGVACQWLGIDEHVDPKTGRTKANIATKTYLQIGNAVPPVLAAAILSTIVSTS